MKTTAVTGTLRKWIQRRLLAAEPTTDAFEIRYMNDGSPLGTIAAPQGGKLEQVTETLFDELSDIATDHAMTADGMHRFSVEAFGPRPERRPLAAFQFQLTTTGAGLHVNHHTLTTGKTVEVPTAFEALERLMPEGELTCRNGGIQDIAHLLNALQNASNQAVPAATLKVGLDFSSGLARMFIEVLPAMLRMYNDTLGQMSQHIGSMRDRDIEMHEKFSAILLANDLRKLEVKTAIRREKRRDRRMDKLWGMGKALLPDLIEQVTGESLVLQLLNGLTEEQFDVLQGLMNDKQRQHLEAIIMNAKGRSERIKKSDMKKKARKAAKNAEKTKAETAT